MQFVLQVYTGTYFAKPTGTTASLIYWRLEEAISLVDVSDVIIGWNTDETLLRPVLDVIHSHGMKAWLWLPVFSEIPANEKSEPQINLLSKASASRQEPVADAEDFTFVCPSSPYNRSIPLSIYDRFFATLPFDGVFLDKIRQNGFADGLASGIGCTCERCLKRYEGTGVDMAAMLGRIVDKPHLLLPMARKGARYQFDDPDVDRYFKAKAACITEAVTELIAAFHSRNLRVGLDVFAPLLALYVGQDIEALAKDADFIKPMLYYRTNAPAGIPFEMARLLEATGDDPDRMLRGLWGVAGDDELGCAMKQMEELAQPGGSIWPGFEINRVPGICNSDSDYVTKMAQLLASIGLDKMVLSWNLLNDTKENLEALSK